jgi:hypothetical protein
MIARSLLLALPLALLLVLSACGDDSGAGTAADGAPGGDGDSAGAGDGDADDVPADQEGGAVATDDTEAMDTADPEPDGGAAPPPVDAPIVDQIEGDDAFDLETCKEVVFDAEAGERDPRCGECCMLRAYTLARFVFEQTCACGDRPVFEDTSVCEASAAEADCSSCCEDAGFELGSAADGGCSCTREPRSDAQVCDAARGQDEPLVACEACCLEAGLFGFTFTAGDDGECRCLEPG